MPPSRPQKTALVVAQRIVADIHRRGNRVDDRLPPERAMLEQYEVGRGTLRESLRFLELQGVISLKPGPGGGPVVRRPDPVATSTSLSLLLQLEGASVREVAVARLELEPVVASLAAERVSDEQVTQMALLAGEERAFHRALAACSGNLVLTHLVDVLLDLLPSPAHCGDPTARREAHQTLLRAMTDRDRAAVGSAMRDHVSACLRHLEDQPNDLLGATVRWEGTTA